MSTLESQGVRAHGIGEGKKTAVLRAMMRPWCPASLVTLSLAHTHTRSLAFPLCLSLTLSLDLSIYDLEGDDAAVAPRQLGDSLSHTQTHSLSRSPSLSLPHSLFLSPSLTHTATFRAMMRPWCPGSLVTISLSHTHSLALPLSLPHTHT